MVLNFGVASGMFLVLYGFDLGAFGHPEALLGRNGEAAAVWRFAGFVDMVSYLLFAPAVIYLHGRFMAVAGELSGHAWVARLVTGCGLGFVLVGAIGAALMAAAGPALLELGRTDPDTVRVAFLALVSSVAVGLWGTLELLLLGVWLVGLAWWVRREDRLLAAIAAISAVGVSGYAAQAGLTGQLPLDRPGPVQLAILGAVGFLPLTAILVGWNLWRSGH